MGIKFEINGTAVDIEVDSSTPLLEVLRNDLKLNGPKFGCGLAQCGACAVLLNGKSIRACVTPLATVAGQTVTTIEGLGNQQNPHPLQTAFINHQALQCGYCASGVIVTAADLLRHNPEPNLEDIKQALKGHLCRCGAQPRMLRAVLDAAKSKKEI